MTEDRVVAIHLPTGYARSLYDYAGDVLPCPAHAEVLDACPECNRYEDFGVLRSALALALRIIPDLPTQAALRTVEDAPVEKRAGAPIESMYESEEYKNRNDR